MHHPQRKSVVAVLETKNSQWFNDPMLTQSDLDEVRTIIHEEVKEEVKTQLTDFRSDMITRLDAILKVTTDTQQELVLANHKIVEHTDQLDNHEDRLTAVESTIVSLS